MRQPAEDAEPIVDRHYDDATCRQPRAVVHRLGLDPAVKAPPCIQKKTGALRASAGAQIFSVRQSSLIGSGPRV